ncbi:MAG: glutamyl-tRNA reductase [Arenicella sp.]
MSLFSLGISHQTAPVAIRERVAVPDETLREALTDLHRYAKLEETSIVSTCNRTEIYCRQDTQSGDDTKRITEWLCGYKGMHQDDLAPFLYTHPNQHAVNHAFRVASGLDSMVLGESQILGQMKTAFSTAHQEGKTGKILNRLFQQSFSVAKQVRTQTAIGANAVSVAFAAVNLAKQIFADLSEQRVLMIGAGETIALAAQHLQAQGVKNFTIANRTIERGVELANNLGGRAIELSEISNELTNAEIVISSTASTLPILGKGMIESTLKKRKNKRMFLVDLAVPRDIEPEVAKLSNVYLYTVDDLQEVVSENMDNRKRAAKQAEGIIDTQTGEFIQWLNNLDHEPLMKALREQTLAISHSEVERSLKKIQAGDNPEMVLQQLAHTISRKFLHRPTTELTSNSDEHMLDAARKLFGLNESIDSNQLDLPSNELDAIENPLDKPSKKH